MKIMVKRELPKNDDIDGVPAEFLLPQSKDEYEQLDYRTETKAVVIADFENRYRQFYADLYALHKKYYNISSHEDFVKLSSDIGALGESYPLCTKIIVSVFEQIEKAYVGGEGARK